MERKSQATKNILEKDINKLESGIAQSLVYQKAIIREQKETMKVIEMKKEEMINRRDSAQKQLQLYIDGKEHDEKYIELKWEYESCLEGIDSLNKARTICEESIEEVKLGMDRM